LIGLAVTARIRVEVNEAAAPATMASEKSRLFITLSPLMVNTQGEAICGSQLRRPEARAGNCAP
jgi:hypothetical protein